MARFLAGVGSALLLVAAGFFVWKGAAREKPSPVPAAPAAQERADPSFAAGPAPVAAEATREQRRFGRYDRDRDGSVARDEYLASRRKAFAKLDANGDGRLSFDEYAAKAVAKYAAADTDKSGTLDAAEFAKTRVARKAPPRCPPVRTATAEEEG